MSDKISKNEQAEQISLSDLLVRFFMSTGRSGIFSKEVAKTYNQLLQELVELKPKETVPIKFGKGHIAKAEKVHALAGILVKQLKAH